MLSFFTGILGEFLPWIVGAAGVVLAMFTARQSGKKAERTKQRIKDYERAEEIRNRVRRDTADRVRQFDDAGWRDGE